MKFFRSIVLLVLILFLSSPANSCRFWVGVGDNVSQDAIHHLIKQPQSLKVLGEEYQDGWSVGYYDNAKPIVRRSALASNVDERFDQAVGEASRQPADLVFAHLRRASSGCVDGVANPHPFKMVKNGKTWLFGHNGGMSKQILIDLIGNDYLSRNPPVICVDNPPDTWIDSELYFIYLMKSIESHAWDVSKGIQHGLLGLYQMIPEKKHYFNFFLTDGQVVWVFRKGTSLHYLEDSIGGKLYVSSTIPSEDHRGWREFPEDTLAVLEPKNKIKFTLLDHYVSTY